MPRPDDGARRLLDGVARLGVVLRTESWRFCSPRRLTPTQAQVLRVLHSRGRQGLRLSEVARELGVSAPTASEAVAALCRKRLVRKQRSGDDGRALTLLLDARGQRLAQELDVWPDALVKIAGSMPDRGPMLRGIVWLIHELEVQGLLPVARLCVSCENFQPNVHPGTTRSHHCTFIDAPVGDGDVRVDCPAHRMADGVRRAGAWNQFFMARPEGRRRRRKT